MDEGIVAGARARQLTLLLSIGLTTLQRWRRQFAGAGDGVDRRKGSSRHVPHRLSEEERQRILLTCNEQEFAALPPGQIVPILADRGLFIGLERSFYRVLHAHGQVNRRGRARPPQEPRPVPRLRADGPNQVWSWVCCGPSLDQGLATTTHNSNCCSAQQNTGPITQGGHSPVWRRHACGWRHLWTGTTTGTTTAASSS